MTVELYGEVFQTNSEAAATAGVTRQTLWRWRAAGQIPLGRQYRGKTILFTEEEVEEIVRYAHRIEPVSQALPGQLGLFRQGSKDTNQ